MDRSTYHSPVSERQSPGQPPRIGITTYRETATWGVWNEAADLLPSSYADAVTLAGGAALLLPPATHDDLATAAEAVLEGVHGLALAGGPDIDPHRYRAERDPHSSPPRPNRDAWEIQLAHTALAHGLPVLAICRGMQVLNVALGGDLIQHLPDVVGNSEHCPVIGRHGKHEVVLAPDSRLGSLLGLRATVATYHHQGLAHLGSELVAIGWAADGTIEAVEHAGAPWVVGVQWHPEVRDGGPLFRGFITACAAYRARLHQVGV
jgi:gamma-glutamyl-gamma-aminobutyrate hydrolase PuuD